MADEPTASVEITLQEKMRFEARNEEGASVLLDAPGQHGGSGQGFSPMDMLLIGLGGCTGMDVISILRKKRQVVTSYRIEVEGKRAQTHPTVFTDIAIRHVLQGDNLTEDAVQRSVELSESKYCPAFAMLQQTARISSTVEILPAVPAD